MPGIRGLGRFLIKDYVWDTYKVSDEKILSLFNRKFSSSERLKLKWHVSVAAGEKMVIVMEEHETIEKVLVLDVRQEKGILLKPGSQEK